MRKLLCVSASALVLASAANADFVDVTFTGAGAGEMVKIISPGHNGDVFAGQILLTLSNSTGANYDGQWIAFCTDLYQTVTTNTETYEVLPVSSLPMGAPMGALRALAINNLYTAAAGAQYTGDSYFAAAFQLAIWEVVTDYVGGPSNIGDISTGAFQATSTDGSPLVAPIAFYLNALLSAIGNGSSVVNLVGLGNADFQDQLIDLDGGFIPAPGVLMTGALGVLLAGKRRRRA